MPTRQQFLKAINADPHNVALRLQFADWLEEQGDPLCDEWRMVTVHFLLRPDCFETVFDGFEEGYNFGDGPAYGYGSGDGDGYGHGEGDEDGNGHGDGYWCEFGQGNGDGGGFSIDRGDSND